MKPVGYVILKNQLIYGPFSTFAKAHVYAQRVHTPGFAVVPLYAPLKVAP